MKICCFGCGVEKDTEVLEFYTLDTGIVQDEPISPLFLLCCEGPGDEPMRQTMVCHGCFHRLDPDMWIDHRGWAGIEPRVPFERLPGHDTSRCCGDRESIESCASEGAGG
jgi:hypothetical protein